MSKRKTFKQLHKEVIKCKEHIAKERDKLRDFISEAQDILDESEQAIDYIETLESSVDELSKYF